jgi:acyl-CoA thioesterase-1
VSIRSICLAIIACLCLVPPGTGHAAAAAPGTILVLGDSLSAGYGIRVEQGWVALLQDRLKQEGYEYRVVNASASGETTGGALARLPRSLEKQKPTIVIVELGGNDGLRGLPIADVRANFESMIRLSQQAGARILLIGMRIPPNYGPEYTKAFHDLYLALAAKHRLPLVPFFLDGIALDDSLMQEDGLHPTAVAQPRLVEQVWPMLKPLLRKAAIQGNGNATPIAPVTLSLTRNLPWKKSG